MDDRSALNFEANVTSYVYENRPKIRGLYLDVDECFPSHPRASACNENTKRQIPLSPSFVKQTILALQVVCRFRASESSKDISSYSR